MKKIVSTLSALLLALSFSTVASAAMCYQIFSSANALVWQGKTPPVVLDSLDLNDEVKKMVPGGHLIIVDDQNAAPCQPVDTTQWAAPKREEDKLPDN
jgi:hypothetical protein